MRSLHDEDAASLPHHLVAGDATDCAGTLWRLKLARVLTPTTLDVFTEGEDDRCTQAQRCVQTGEPNRLVLQLRSERMTSIMASNNGHQLRQEQSGRGSKVEAR